jgi:hypothetical protein
MRIGRADYSVADSFSVEQPPAPATANLTADLQANLASPAAKAATANRVAQTSAVTIPRNREEVRQLAEKFSPVFHMHPKEKYLPGDPNTFIARASLRKHISGWFDKTLAEKNKINPASLAKQRDEGVYIDGDDSDTARRGNPANSPVLYQYNGGQPPTMTYWLFTPYNNKALNNLPDQNHEGDWERITVVFQDNKNGTISPSEVRYSSHGSGTALPWQEAPKTAGDANRPKVYVGLGSHAMSPYPVNQPIEGIPILDLVDYFAEGGITIDSGKTSDSAGRTRLKNIEEEAWWGTRVHWGERGKLAAFPSEIVLGDGKKMKLPTSFRNQTSGVTGPSPDPDGNGPLKGKGALGPTTRRPVDK